MKLALSAVIAAALCACAASPIPTTSPPPSSPEPTATQSAAVPLTATELLECDGEPSDVGGATDDLAFDGGGETPDGALATFLANTLYVIPRTGYEALARSGDRYAYGYRADGAVKVVIVISPRFADLAGVAYTADELRTCPESEFGSEAEFNDDRRVWTHLETGAILTDIPGPQHCGWQSARIMHVEENGALVKQYLRDPDGVFDQIPLLDSYAEGVELPANATDSGYRSPEGFELWFTKADTAAYVVTSDGVERWPRPADIIGCA